MASRELRKAGPCGCCGDGYCRFNGRSSPKRVISRSSAATLASGTEIYAGAATNVCEIDEDGRPTLGLCFLPSGNLPIGDVMLSQKIALESSENHALRLARRIRSGWHVPAKSAASLSRFKRLLKWHLGWKDLMPPAAKGTGTLSQRTSLTPRTIARRLSGAPVADGQRLTPAFQSQALARIGQRRWSRPQCPLLSAQTKAE